MGTRSLQHGKAVWLSTRFMGRVAVAVGLISRSVGLIRADIVRHVLRPGRADAKRRAMYEAWTAGFTVRRRARLARAP
jgi:hypothetical protein